MLTGHPGIADRIASLAILAGRDGDRDHDGLDDDEQITGTAE